MGNYGRYVILVMFFIASCKNRHLPPTVQTLGYSSLANSADTSIYGNYILGRPLSGVFLYLHKDGIFSQEYFCDICAKNIHFGTYHTKGDSIFLNDTMALIEFRKEIMVSGKFNTYTPDNDSLHYLSNKILYRWNIDGIRMIGYSALTDSAKLVARAVIVSGNKYMCMDMLPYRKISDIP